MYKLEELQSLSCTVNINNKWVPARPYNYKLRTIWTRLHEAYLVFIGKADCFTWPENQ